MMNLWAKLSIKAKIIGLVILVVTLAFASAFILVIFNDINAFKTRLIEEYNNVIEVYSSYSIAPLAFGQPEELRAFLESSLVNQSIIMAVVYNLEKEPLISVRRDYTSFKIPGADDPFVFSEEPGYLNFFTAISIQQETLGYFYLKVSTSKLNRLIYDYLIYTILILIFTIVVSSIVLIVLLRQHITDPILRLLGYMNKIRATDDLKIRIESAYSDELGQLFEGFNMMISKLEERNLERDKAEAELRNMKDHLQQLVEDRTLELRKAQDELIVKEKMAVLGQLTATISHEIRNPLGTVRMSVFSIGDALEKKDTDRIKRSLTLAERNIVRCDRIIDELLQYTRKKTLAKRPIELDQWVSRQILDYGFPEDIKIEQQLESKCTVMLDSDNFRRVFVNLVENAIHAMDEYFEEEKLLRFETRASSGHVLLIITDTGAGITIDTMKNIFEPLFSTKSFGVGLGMSIVKDIIEMHGGEINIDSKPQKGTSMTIKLYSCEVTTDEQT